VKLHRQQFTWHDAVAGEIDKTVVPDVAAQVLLVSSST
jgi:hypothetical protein